ncbi:DUF167 domain-containing protein [Alkanindiges sp. WGS2144]|uniref:DUF167 domain-containing protein n=1 Tax=Alkanindiges sp. WGS2144 TaxID=3366808 RepID=UPI003751DE0F
MNQPAMVELWVKVSPNAKISEITGWETDTHNKNYLKVRLAAPPVDGKANKLLCEFLAKTFGVAKRNVLLVSGDTSRLKRVNIIAPQRLPEFLQQI